MDLFTNTQLLFLKILIDGLEWCGLLVNYCDACISCFTFPVAQMVEHGASNAKIMGSIPRESKS